MLIGPHFDKRPPVHKQSFFLFPHGGPTIKKYYWLKLKNDFFKSRSMKKLRKIAGGDTYTIIYLKLQLLSLQNNGDLHFEGVEENLLEELALDIDESVENVQATMFFLEKCGLVTDVSPEKVSLPEVKENTGTETSSAERVRKHREKKKQLAIGVNEGQKVLQSNKEVTKCNTETEKEKELELKKEKEKIKDIKKELDNNINDIYKAYPRKIGKPKALKSIEKALTKIPFDELLPIVVMFAKSRESEDPKFTPHPSTWFNEERWNDTEDFNPKKKFVQQSLFKNKPQLGVNTLTQEERDELPF